MKTWIVVGLLIVGSGGLGPDLDGQVSELGVGVVNPPLDPERPLYLYLGLDSNQFPPTVPPSDSLTFVAGLHNVDLATAPPWFAPEGMKLDYDLLYLRAVQLTRYWVQVVVNATSERPRSFPRTAWVARDAVSFRTWPEFLLDVYSVEVVDPADNPLREGPGEGFATLGSLGGIPLHVEAIQGSWAKVSRADGNESDPRRGWIRWTDGDVLLVTYDLLS